MDEFMGTMKMTVQAYMDTFKVTKPDCVRMPMMMTGIQQMKSVSTMIAILVAILTSRLLDALLRTPADDSLVLINIEMYAIRMKMNEIEFKPMKMTTENHHAERVPDSDGTYSTEYS